MPYLITLFWPWWHCKCSGQFHKLFFSARPCRLEWLNGTSLPSVDDQRKTRVVNVNDPGASILHQVRCQDLLSPKLF
jgi:hypothetical protein